MQQRLTTAQEGSEGEGLDTQLKLAWPEVLVLLESTRWLAADAHIQQLEQSTGVSRADLPCALEACGQSSAAEVEAALQNVQSMLHGMHRFEASLADSDRYHQSSHKPLQVTLHHCLSLH